MAKEKKTKKAPAKKKKTVASVYVPSLRRLYKEQIVAVMQKQFNYANKRNIPNVVLVGDEELASNSFTLKNMASGEQQMLSLEALIKALK